MPVTEVHEGYRVGPWVLDVVVGSGDDAVALETWVLDADPTAHIERHLTLSRLGLAPARRLPEHVGPRSGRACIDLTGSLAATRASETGTTDPDAPELAPS